MKEIMKVTDYFTVEELRVLSSLSSVAVLELKKSLPTVEDESAIEKLTNELLILDSLKFKSGQYLKRINK